MHNLLDKIKKIFSTHQFKAGFWATILTILMFVPFIILTVIILMQFSLTPPGAWPFIFVMIMIFILIICFSNVLYTKLLNNYANTSITKKAYLKIFLNELLGPFGIGLLIIALIVYLDQLSKIMVVTYLEEGISVPFIKHLLNWRLDYNTGAAWSIMSGHTNVLAIISLVATFVLLYLMKDFDLKKRKLYSIAIAMILGGTIGNMIDRFFRLEGVVDFIELGFMNFPIFNLADSFLVVGTIILAISILFTKPFKNQETEEQPLSNTNLETEEVEEGKQDD